MLRTLVINSNQSMLSFGVLIAFLSPKQIWDGGEFFGIHARSILGQGVWIHHRRAFGQHIRVGFAPDCRHLHPDMRRHFHPDVRCHFLHPDCCHCIRLPCTSTQMFTSGILTPDRKGERFNFSGRTYPDPLIAPTRRVSQTILYSAAVFSWSF